jgi:hypothetical protein
VAVALGVTEGVELSAGAGVLVDMTGVLLGWPVGSPVGFVVGLAGRGVAVAVRLGIDVELAVATGVLPHGGPYSSVSVLKS